MFELIISYDLGYISKIDLNYFRKVIEVCQREGVQVRLCSDFFSNITANLALDNIYGLNIIIFDRNNHSNLQLALKRLSDIIGAIIGIIIFSPFMIIAALIILISDGPQYFINRM